MLGKENFNLVPIARTDVFQELLSQLEELLASGQFQPGDKLPPERELATKLGVSRASVRQAIKVLESHGKVESRTGSGNYVIENSSPAPKPPQLTSQVPDEVNDNFIRHLIVARSGIERAVFDACCDIITEEGIQELEKLLDDNYQGFVFNDPGGTQGGLDLGFEAKVGELTGNKILTDLQGHVHSIWRQAWRKYGFTPEKNEILHKQHLELLSALRRHDRDLLLALLANHVNKNVISNQF